MSGDSIKKKLDELYSNSKSKNFINHIIKAYLPVNKVSQVLDKPAEGRLVCVITNQKLITANEILAGMQSDDFKASLKTDLVEALEGKQEPTAMTKLINGRTLALTGDKTTTFISYAGMQGLLDWVAGKLLENDKHITWLMKSMRDAEKPVFKKKSQLEINGYRKPATTMGELDALQKLKAKFEAEGR